MRTTQYMLSTLKEVPSNTEIISHQLMLRAGMIRKLASGLYSWLPTGIRVLRKVENIIREEMNNIGAIEISMPIVQPFNLWEKSGRWQQYGLELINIKDRHQRSFVLSPTHEEVITDLIRNEITSYKQLPLILYQIQTKFRDEIRPRFGIIRSREFMMKDAYSFHISQESLQETYDIMYSTYNQIFNRMDLDYRVVEADTGSIGGNLSHEFQVLAQNGEDDILFSNKSNYAANIEKVEAFSPFDERLLPTQKMIQFDTPKVKNITEFIHQYHFPIKKVIKTLLVKASKKSGYKMVALLLRGDHQLNYVKAEQIDIVSRPIQMSSEEEIRNFIGVGSAFLGPIGLSIPIIADRAVINMSDFCAGANIDGKHLKGINWGRDLPEPRVEDIRNAVDGDPSPDGAGILHIKRGIEIGHIFQLGNKYSKMMEASVRNKNGDNQVMTMGCYGIGISRIVAATIEQRYDNHGIIWPIALAPFKIAIIPINLYKSLRVKKTVENIYQELLSKGIEVILDDREENPGVMFADMELIGIPHIIIISDRNLNKGVIEYKERSSHKKQYIMIKQDIDIINFLFKILKK